MNILLSAGYLYRFPFANNNIEILLADTLAELGHTCFVYGFSTDLCGEKTLPSGTTLARHNPYPLFERALLKLERFVEADTTDAARITLVKHFALRHPFSAAMVILSRRPFFARKFGQQYARTIQKFTKEHKIDAVVCFAYPFPFVEAVTKAGLDVPVLYYQFDPYGLHEHTPDAERDAHIAQEVAAIQHAARTITTRVLYEQYAAHPAYQPFIDRCVAMDFPAFCEKAAADVAPAFAFEKDKINLLFCGTIDDGFRSPKYFIETCIPLFDTMPNLRLCFLGSITSAVLADYAARYPQNILLHPVVESDVANKTIAEADILLNIGNSITNMMPSKIFDYFATGKPIVNVQKIANCPARSYFEKYPMQITLAEYAAAERIRADNDTDTNIIGIDTGADVGTDSSINSISSTRSNSDSEALAAFLLAHKGKQLPYAEILPRYETATPRYVASEIERMIKELHV